MRVSLRRPSPACFSKSRVQPSKPSPTDSWQFPSEPHTTTLYWSPRWLSRIISLPICSALPSVTVTHPDSSFDYHFSPPTIYFMRTGKKKGNLQLQPLLHTTESDTVRWDLNNYPASVFASLTPPKHNCYCPPLQTPHPARVLHIVPSFCLWIDRAGGTRPTWLHWISIDPSII